MFIDHYDPNATSAPEITFRVNTRYIEDFTIGAGVRVVFGNNDSWIEMSDDNGDSIYTCTVSHEQGAELYYYFSYRKGSGSDTAFIDERYSLAGTECCDDEGYRILTVEVSGYLSATGIPGGIWKMRMAMMFILPEDLWMKEAK